MASSDNKIAQYRIGELVSPEVYGSDFTSSLYNVSFDRFMSRDDTKRVAGYIGTPNTNGAVNRQVQETSEFRQRNQLQPIVTTAEGSDSKLLSFERFISTLELMNVDVTKLKDWAFTTSFNFAPPINMDKLINFADYYWVGEPGERPQYAVIEDRCAAAQSKLDSYDQLLLGFDTKFSVVSIDVEHNTMTLNGAVAQVFVPGFVFYTTSSLPAFDNQFWTVVESEFIADTGTTVLVLEPIATHSLTPPTNPTLYQLWFHPETKVLNMWNGVDWEYVAPNYTVIVSLEEMRGTYQIEVNCACHGDQGWDINQWDDNQKSSILWNEQILSQISWPSETDWEANNPGAKTNNSLWFDTVNDTLNAWSVQQETWRILNHNFSAIVEQTQGRSLFDATIGCELIEVNDWMRNNKWKHKTQLSTFSNAIRAQVPILEYSATIEFNNWLKVIRSWKYRKTASHQFETVSASPKRIELEPVKGYVADVLDDEWLLYLYDPMTSGSQAIDYTDTFKPGYQFRIVNDQGDVATYTTQYSVFRNLNLRKDTERVVDRIGSNTLVTVVTIKETDFSSAAATSQYNDRLIPVQTSQGDDWAGYHINWMLDPEQSYYAPAGKPMLNSQITDVSSPVTRELAGIGTLVVYKSAQELSIFTEQSTISIDSTLWFNQMLDNAYGTQSSVVVYVNGRQLGTNEYTTQTSTGAVSTTAVGSDLLDGFEFEYVTAVVLNVKAEAGDVIRIEVGAQASVDRGFINVPVRTVEDETEFAIAVANKTQPVYMSIEQYIKYAQNKVEDNQYPQFNAYHIQQNQPTEANPIFTFTESSEMDIDQNTLKRIVRTPDYGDFQFMQHLIKEDNGATLAYRDIKSVGPRTFWYSPTQRTLMFWYDNSWNDVIVDEDANRNISHSRPIISETEPQPIINDSYWYDPVQNTLTKRVGNRWVLQSRPIVNETDPTLVTIWRTGAVPTQYVPSQLNDGNWDILDSWYFNPSNDNWKEIKYTELAPHFNDIMSRQQKVPGLPSGGAFTLTQDQVNVGLGGFIKEFNYNLDNLISLVNLEYTNPVDLITFARDQYQQLIDFARTSTIEKLPSVIATDDPSIISTSLTQQFENELRGNNLWASVYYDTTSFDGSVGIRNWVMTLPVLGSVEPIKPIAHSFGDRIEIRHHDGHTSVVTLSAPDRVNTISKLVNTYSAAFGRKLGVVNRYSPPSTTIEFEREYATDKLFIGAIWHDTYQSKLYRFSPVVLADRHPSVAGLVDGTTYYNTSENTSYELTNGQWIPTALPGSNSIIGCWIELNLVQYVADVIVALETNLYNVAVARNAQLEYLFADVTQSDAAARERELESRFLQYVTTVGETNVLLNTHYRQDDPFTWNYSKSLITEYPTAKTLKTIPSYWKQLYVELYGTEYPHLEPWILQGFVNKPDWWDDEYLNNDTMQYGDRRWKYKHDPNTDTGVGMWENIRTGFIPHGRTMPTGFISEVGNDRVPKTYRYFSVNIGQDILVNRYKPDDILPPYFKVDGTTNTRVRSVFTDYANQVIGPNSDYATVMNSVQAWEWKQSISYQYDKVISQFLIQPIRTLFNLMGRKYTTVSNLIVDYDEQRVASHSRTNFHGAVVDGKLIQNNGILQWLVNYNRFGGYDSGQEFHNRWSNWTSKLSYMTGSTNDTTQTRIYNKLFDITDRDYNFVFANTSLLDKIEYLTFKLNVVSYPPQVDAYNNDNEWVLELSTTSDISTTVRYYQPIVYPFVVNNGLGQLNHFVIRNVDKNASIINVVGDVQSVFEPGVKLAIKDSPNNDGNYTVLVSEYNTVTDMTRVSLVESLKGSIGGGFVELDNFHPLLNTGDIIHINSTNRQPGDVRTDRTYFVRMINTTQFEVYDSMQGAIDGTPEFKIGLRDPKLGNLQIGKVDSSFSVFGGLVASNKVWYHYTLSDKLVERIMPITIRGTQTAINILDGYARYVATNEKVIIDGSVVAFDELTGRANGWQYQQEQMLIYALSLRSDRSAISERYPAILSRENLVEFEFRAQRPTFVIGQQVQLSPSGNATLPAPLSSDRPYFFKPTENGFELYEAVSMQSGSRVQLVDTTFAGTIYVSKYAKNAEIPTFTVIPSQHKLKISTPFGIMSNIFEGPTGQTQTSLLIYDINGERLTSADLMVYRNDDTGIIHYTSEPENNGIGGFVAYVEGYEHVVQFNHYTVDGVMIYDPFLGMRTQRIEVDFYREREPKLRPTLGGYFFSNGDVTRNFEGRADDLRNVYDWYKQRSFSQLSQYAYNLLGYREMASLNEIDVGDKSQILFYQGMIKYTGTETALLAYVNSKYFSNVEVDEFWSVKVGSFGSIEPKRFPEVKLKSTDNYYPTINLAFTEVGETLADVGITNPDVVEVSFNLNSDRWVDYPIIRTEYTSPLILQPKTVDKTYDVSAIVTVNGNHYLKVDPFNRADVIISGELVDSTEYEEINHTYLRFNVKPTSDVTVRGYSFDTSKGSPIKIIDKLTSTTVHTIPYWDPAFGKIDYLANHNINVRTDIDPAVYNDTYVQPAGVSFWDWDRIGYRWADTSRLQYVPYYDHTIFPDDGVRATLWGKQADWSSQVVYQWVESSVHPDSYTGAGIPKKTLMTKTRTTQDVVGNGTSVVTVDPNWISRNGVKTDSTVGFFDGDIMVELSVEVISSTEIKLSLADDEYIVDDQLTLTLFPSFNGIFWTPVEPTITEYVGAMVNSNKELDVSGAYDVGVNVGVYVNGTLEIALIVPATKLLDLSNVSFKRQDIIHVVYEPEFDDSDIFDELSDDGRLQVWQELTQFSSSISPTTGELAYYFWVSDIREDAVGERISVYDTTQRLNMISYPYFKVGYLRDSSVGLRYRTLNIQNASNIVTGDDRLVLRLVEDGTRRDNFRVGPKHEQWKLIRRGQTTKIDRVLWDKLISSMVGFDIASQKRLPSLELTMWDDANDTTLRYGIGDDQIMAPTTTLRSTVKEYLISPTTDLYPVDIDNFLSSADFDTTAGIIEAMNSIYDNFSTRAVNDIWFEALNDGLTVNNKYADVMKTSWVALTGDQRLDVNGMLEN